MRILSSRSRSSRFLLWVMFLNMAFGMAAHQAMHLHAGSADTQQVLAMETPRSAAAEPAGDAQPPTPQEAPTPAADHQCLGCHALSQLAAAAAPPPAPTPVLPVAAPQATPAPPHEAVLPSAGRWRFASRDPPARG